MSLPFLYNIVSCNASLLENDQCFHFQSPLKIIGKIIQNKRKIRNTKYLMIAKPPSTRFSETFNKTWQHFFPRLPVCSFVKESQGYLFLLPPAKIKYIQWSGKVPVGKRMTSQIRESLQGSLWLNWVYVSRIIRYTQIFGGFVND